MIYFDNHATTPVAPEVLDAMTPFWSHWFANPASSTHVAGREVAEQVTARLEDMARFLGCLATELVMTSGARRAIIWQFWERAFTRVRSDEESYA